MQIFLNGQARQCDAATTIADLLADEGHAQRRVAVEVNQAIVPRSAHASHRLAEGDRVEVVTAFGGG
ncbi:MAG: sulfur carrier protein ThiS [Proteobacteria bacterium]|nr:sulfur carrier protein ThiS [Pseudomonadota bacterium]